MAQIIVRLKDRELQRVPVTHVATRIGRDASNDVVINNDGVSRHHATLRYEPAAGAFLIQDTSSGNGLTVRGAPARVARLEDGDEVQLGKFTLVFREGGGVAPDALAPEALPASAAPEPAVYNPLPTVAFPPPGAPAPPATAPAAADALADYDRLLRRIVWLLAALVAMLAVLVAVLLRR